MVRTFDLRIDDKKVRLNIPDKLFGKIEAEAEKHGKSKNQTMLDLMKESLKRNAEKKQKSLDLIRSPIDTTCADCKKPLPFGRHCYYHPDMGALCLECGEKRGYTHDERVKQILKEIQLNYNIKSLKWKQKDLTQEILDQQKLLNIYALGMKHEELEKKKQELIQLNIDFIRSKIGTDQEKQAIEEIKAKIREIDEFKKEIQEMIRRGLFMPIKKKKKKKPYVA